MVERFLAHSASDKAPPQEYAEHVSEVVCLADAYASAVEKFIKADDNEHARFVDSVKAAALHHDLGKLLPENQQVLRSSSKRRLPINHVDAGSARLLQTKEMGAALLVYSHHAGLPSLGKEEVKREYFLRIPDVAEKAQPELDRIFVLHETEVKLGILPRPAPASKNGLFHRMALSCLVDADHSDTARHYSRMETPSPPSLRPSVRLQYLDDFVAKLSSDSPESERTKLRQEVYQACRNAPIDPAIRSCDSPVGTGKTTAVMAHLLRVAQERGLRRVFVVLPFVNIINQSVDVYRKALVLPDENPESVVTAHHHRADFATPVLRAMSFRWDAPVVVTTAVQFFETLASNHPSSLRKLHQVAGSAIFIDEAHAALPAHLWPMAWQWLRELAGSWGCHIVLASGSLRKFWTLPEFSHPPADIPELLPENLREDSLKQESNRIVYHRHELPVNCEKLLDVVLSGPGPRLVILNTVYSAAYFADSLRKRNGDGFVEHLSTALSPKDREPVINRVRKRLLDKNGKDWVFVATSCVESGLDFSFQTAFRESCGLVNLLQVGGRVNRHSEPEYINSEVKDFRLADPKMTIHPGFRTSSRILGELFKEGKVGPQWVTEAMRREIREDPDSRGETLVLREKNHDYPDVADLFRVINSPTMTVIVDHKTIQRLESDELVSWREIQDVSVQIWANKMRLFPIRPIEGSEELWAWNGKYDGFLGYMAGVLPLNDPESYAI
jgi:CRISPR-associated endonuclease/helicase Cas3